MWRVKIEEDPDWGFARNMQIILKTQNAEFSSSSFPSRIETGGRIFYGGNRDYSWQGLVMGPLHGVPYKTVDAIYFSVGSHLRPVDVHFRPGECIYRYDDEDGEVFVRITLENSSGRVFLRALANRPCWFMILLDFTPLDKWVESTYITKFTQGGMTVESSAVPLQLLVGGFDRAEFTDLEMTWRYKLGDGFRRIKDGFLVFNEHWRPVRAPYAFYSSTGRIEISVPTFGNSSEEHGKPGTHIDFGFGGGVVAEALQLRLETLSTYGITALDRWFPEAGSWWFRRPWMRDGLEGLRWNLTTYLKLLGWLGKVNSLVRYLLSVIKSRKGLPLILGDNEVLSSDTPPLLLNVACDLAVISENRDLLLATVDACRFASERLLGGMLFSESLLESSIICSPANSSWIDSIVTIEGKRWPTRLPETWIAKDIDPFKSDYGFVEVNALYIEALQKVTKSCEDKGLRIPREVETLLETLSEGFVKRFKRKDDLPLLTVAPSYKLSDPTPSSSALVALPALNGSIYNTGELRQIWPVILNELLVTRTLVTLGKEREPFGVLVRAVKQRPYIGDEEYHAATIWPRDTPYLIRVLEMLGRDVRGILLNNLDHMITEGAFGYSSELFSLPLGENPATSLNSNNPVPVKNPAQYWSHWCDPYLQHLTELGTDQKF